MARVLVTRHVPREGLEPLAAHELAGPDPTDRALTKAELEALAPGVDGILCLLTDRIGAGVLAAGRSGRLRVVANVAVGYDNIDIAAAKDLGIAVCNTPDVLTDATADLAMLLVLSAMRRSPEAAAALRAGKWREWRIDAFLGRDLTGATLGIVGFGRIGRAVCRRAGAFGMRVLHWSRSPTGEHGWVDDLDDLLARVDVVSLHVPGTPDTHHLLDERRIRLLPRGALLINTSRGSVVDEQALAAALEDGHLYGAGLDVYEHEPDVHPRLLAAPNTVLLPHVGSATIETRRAMVRLAASGIADVLDDRTPPNLVVAPAS